MLRTITISSFFGAAILCASLVLLSALPAHAQKIREMFGKEMPVFEQIPEKDFIEQTFLQEDMPFGDKALAYNIRLPKAWEAPEDRVLSNYNLSTHLLGEIALFYSPPKLETLRSKFQIQALRLEYDITAEQWLLQYVLSNGFTLEGLKIYNKDKVGSLHVEVKEGETFITRSIAQINGKRMILAQYIIPADSWESESSIVAQSLETFKLLSPESAIIEKLNDHMFLDISKFAYPESWKIQTKAIRSVDRMEALVNNVRSLGESNGQVLDGQISVNMTSSFIMKDLEEELNLVKTEFRKKGLVIGDLVESLEDMEFSKQVEFGFVDIYDANDTQNKSLKYEVWIGVVALKNYYGLVSMLTPSRNADFFIWSRNSSAFNTVLRTLEMQERSVALEQ